MNILTLAVWFGGGMMVGGAIILTIALAGAGIAGAFGWQVDIFE